MTDAYAFSRFIGVPENEVSGRNLRPDKGPVRCQMLRLCGSLLHWMSALLLAGIIIEGTGAVEAKDISLTASTTSLPANNVTIKGTIGSSLTDYFRVDFSACSPSGFLNVEAFNIDRQDEQIGTSVTGQASIMLMVNTARSVPVAIALGSGLWKWNDGTLADYKGYRLVRSYQLLHFNLSDYSQPSPWVVGLLNDDSWASLSVNYAIRAWCTATPACPKNCHGVGKCTAEGTCQCRPGRGGRGCGAIVESLSPRETINGTVPTGGWNYYSYNLTEPGQDLLVEMWRTRGDPVLFVKRKEDGFVAGGVPTVFDFSTYADARSFRERSDYHYILTHEDEPALMTIGVFNNDIDFKEEGVYEIRASSVSGAGAAALCPMNCSYPNGVCGKALGRNKCTCGAGYQGPSCQGSFAVAKLDQAVEGTVEPGGWAFVEFDYDPTYSGNLIITFQRTGGQAILIAKQGSIPALDDNEYRFTTLETSGSLTSFFSMYNSASRGGTHYLAIYNTDYLVHTACSFTLTFSLARSGGTPLTASPIMAIILSLAASISLCLCMGACRSVILRNQHRLGLGLPNLQGDSIAAGLDPKVVASFPLVHFHEELFSAKEDAQCPVCLGEYEPSDILRRLPKCSHYFHIHCIDAWLTKHTTCPICRMALHSAPARASPAPDAEDGLEGQPLTALGRTAQLPADRPPLSLVREEASLELREAAQRPGKEVVNTQDEDCWSLEGEAMPCASGREEYAGCGGRDVVLEIREGRQGKYAGARSAAIPDASVGLEGMVALRTKQTT